jgi:hypothetical protein
MSAAAVEDIDRIAALGDPILRNLQITQCYGELSGAVAALVGASANWCTFATWASKQAGQTIRQEDLLRTFEERFYLSPEISAALENLTGSLKRIGANLPVRASKAAILRALDPRAAFARAGDAVARGNKKVFEEIGREFARFLEFFHGDDRFDAERAARFCAMLRPGDPPDGQRLLSEAFTAYCRARFQIGKEKAETMLLANLCAGYHEQIRLQPEIAEALDAALGDSADLKQRLLAVFLPGFYLRARARLLRDHESFLDGVFARVAREVNRLIRQVITEHLMTLHISNAPALRLGHDLSGNFPPDLQRIENARLKEILDRVDATADNLKDSGAEDWADFADRMHFIGDFFRLTQERRDLFDAPFTVEQAELLRSGALPEGLL